MAGSKEVVDPIWRGTDREPAESSNNLLVVGAPRTGTTLLQAVLCSGAGTNPLMGEVAPLRFLIEAFEKTSRHTRHNLGKIYTDPQDVVTLYGVLVREFIADLRRRHDCTFLILKEPRLTLHLKSLLEVSHDWLIVMIVRDPRAAIASMVQWGTQLPQDSDHPFRRRDIPELARLFNSHYGDALNRNSQLLHSRLLIVRYEDLVQDPGHVRKRLTGFANIKFGPTADQDLWLRSLVDFDQERESRNPSVTERFGGVISTDRISAYNNLLEPDEIEDIERRCASIMHHFDYAPQRITRESVERISTRSEA